MLVLSSSRVHGRLFREIIDANGAKEITTQDNSFSKFLGPKEAVNDASEELSERGDIDKGKRKACQRVITLQIRKENRLPRDKICSSIYCRCYPVLTCDSCNCDVQC